MRTDQAEGSIFVFAHPDDEFFCLPVIRRDVNAGRRVACVYLTDGAYGGQSAMLRVRETTSVLVRNGVDVADIHFVGIEEAIPDGQLHQNADRAYLRLSEIQQRYTGSSFYLPAWEGGHQDHDTCHALGVALACSIGSLLPDQFALYHGYRSGPLFKVMSPLKQNGPLQLVRVSLSEAIQALSTAFSYPSQWKTWIALLPFAAWRILSSRTYALQKATTARLLERPHAGPLLYEKRGNARYEEVRDALQCFLKPIAEPNEDGGR